MQLHLLSSMTFLCLLGQQAQASPIAPKSTNVCSLPWVKLGELALNLLPSSEGPKLCSSVLHKYTTTTQTTTITAPAVTNVATVSSTSTVPALTTSVTTTVPVESDISTTTTAITTATTSISVTISAPPSTNTITASVNEKRAVTTTDCTSRLASLLNIATTLVSEFCSCEAPGSTSTSTVLVSITVTPTTTVPTTIIAATVTPQPSSIRATVLTTFTSVVSTVVLQSTISSTIVSTVTVGASAATVTNPGCPSQLKGTNQDGGTTDYTQYIFTNGFKENTNNPGNDDPSVYPPLTTTFPAGDFCTALQQCATFAASSNNQYDSFDFHFLISENVYECAAYYDPSADASYFNVQDSDVGQAYGYSFSGYA